MQDDEDEKLHVQESVQASFLSHYSNTPNAYNIESEKQVDTFTGLEYTILDKNLSENNSSKACNDTEWKLYFKKLNFQKKKIVLDSHAMWKIEGKNPMEGGELHANTDYKLKHITTGKYLASNNVQQLRLIDNRQERGTNFQFYFKSAQNIPLFNNVFVNLAQNSGKKILYISGNILIISLKNIGYCCSSTRDGN